MISTVAVIPQPPLLVPELATGAAVETAVLRAAVVTALRRCAGAARWVAVGADAAGRRTVPSSTRGTFVGFGVDRVVGLAVDADDPPDPDLPLPLLIAGWAVEAAGVRAPVRGELLAPDTPPAECAALGAALARECAADPAPVALLVVGDGAATHTEKAPGHLDERAGPFDAAVAAALGAADAGALAALDPHLAAALHVAGRAPWQVLAGAAGEGWRGELLHSSAPFGVAYHVAVWTPRR